MKYAVLEIIDDIILLENIETKEKKEINKNSLSYSVVDGDILLFKDNAYIKDDLTKEERLKIIKEKMNQAKNN